MTLYLLLLGIGCLALFGGGELLVRGASATGRHFGLSPAAVGLVLVSLGTSAPELFVSVGAAIQGFGDMAVGNVIGSNIVNLCLVLGLAVVLAEPSFDGPQRQRQVPFMLVLTILSVALLWDRHLGRIEGVVLLAGALVGLVWALRGGSKDVVDTMDGAADDGAPEESIWRAVGALVGGIVLLAAGAEALIYGGVGLATALEVPEAVIALTVTSVGTGLPEIVATCVAAMKREHAIAIGNVVGSNIMNLGLVLGGSSLISPLDSIGIDNLSLGLLIGLSVMLLGLAQLRRAVPRFVGVSLLVGYAAYVFVLAA